LSFLFKGDDNFFIGNPDQNEAESVATLESYKEILDGRKLVIHISLYYYYYCDYYYYYYYYYLLNFEIKYYLYTHTFTQTYPDGKWLNGINTKGTECGTHSFTFETITLEDTDPEDAKESSALAALHAAAETFYHQDAHRAASNTNRT
jgi:hypothetical protein